MKKQLEILGLEKIESKEQVKRAYYKKIKKYPPESYTEKFILLNEAYNIVIDFIDNKKIFKVDNQKSENKVNNFIKIINENIYKKKYVLLQSSVQDIVDMVEVDNFKYINGEVIDMIINLCRLNFESEALYISYVFEKRFEDIELFDLAKAYRRLQERIVINECSRKLN